VAVEGTTTAGTGGITLRVLHVERNTFGAALTRATLEDAGLAVETVAGLDLVPPGSLREYDVCLHRLGAACAPASAGVGLPTVVVPPHDPSSPRELVLAVVTAAEARRAA
jgi:hypothetical protein